HRRASRGRAGFLCHSIVEPGGCRWRAVLLGRRSRPGLPNRMAREGSAMPIHDWTRVDAGTFHDFHNGWLIEMRNVLNGGLLPSPYYAQTDQVAGQAGPDVLTLEGDEPEDQPPAGQSGVSSLALAPPQVRYTATLDTSTYTARKRSLLI